MKESGDQRRDLDEYIIPVEMAVGDIDRCECVFKLAFAGIPFVRMFRLPIVEGTQIGMLYMVKLDDAIRFNENRLCNNKLSVDDERSTRLLLSALRVIDPATLQMLWGVLSCQSDRSLRQEYRKTGQEMTIH